MKKAIKKYLTQLHENEEKGFSLVELIIVMAIMAILVGVVASQVIPYMEKSRQSKDQQQISGLATDITAALASSAVTAQDVAAGTKVDSGVAAMAANATDASKIEAELESLRGDVSSVAAVATSVKNKLKSKAATDGTKTDGEIYMQYDVATSKLTLYMSSDGTLANAVNKLTVESE